MGTLKTTALIDADGGWTVANKGAVVNGITLGEPILLSINPITFGWDDPAIPNGTIDADGVVTADDTDL